MIGLLLFSLLSAFTLGSFGAEGRSFLDDLMQADGRNLFSAFLGGVVFNASNILLAAAVALCGMSVAFPVGVGLALVLGVLINYFGAAKGNPLFIFLGVALIAAAIVMNGLAYRMARTGKRKLAAKGLLISVAAGTIMAFFYRFVASSMDLDSFTAPAAGKMIPYIVPFRAILSGDIRKNEKPYVFQYVRLFVPLHSFRLLSGRNRDSDLLLVFSMYQYVAMYLLFYSVPRLSDFDFWLYPIIYILQFFRENLRCKQFIYPPMTGFSHLQAKRIFGKQPVYGPCKFHCIRIRCFQTRFTV